MFKDHTYRDVEFCEECKGSNLAMDRDGTATCKKCGQGRYLKTVGRTTSCVKKSECSEGHFANIYANGVKCVVCGDARNGEVAGCTECKANTAQDGAKCTRCFPDKYYKVVGETTWCVTAADCGEDYFET